MTGKLEVESRARVDTMIIEVDGCRVSTSQSVKTAGLWGRSTRVIIAQGVSFSRSYSEGTVSRRFMSERRVDGPSASSQLFGSEGKSS